MFLSKYMKIKEFIIIILRVVLCGRETWSLTLREELRRRMFENRVIISIFGSKTDDVAGEWRKLHNEELNDLNFPPNIVRVIESRRMRYVGYVVCMGRGVVHIRFWWGTLRERYHLEDRGMHGRIILRCIFRKWETRNGLN
jgi:hypothetical protein